MTSDKSKVIILTHFCNFLIASRIVAIWSTCELDDSCEGVKQNEVNITVALWSAIPYKDPNKTFHTDKEKHLNEMLSSKTNTNCGQ